MLKKRPVMLYGAIVWAVLGLGGVSSAEEVVKSAKDLIMELSPSPPVEPVRRTRGLVPRAVVPSRPVPKVAPRQVAPPALPVIPYQEDIRYSNDPPPVPVQVVQSPPPPTGSATLSAVQFVYDSEELLPVARRQLDELVVALRDVSLRHTRIQLIGHTDAAGSREYNRALSMRRAYSAARYLTQVHGIPAQRIIPIGMGEDQLLDPYNPLNAINRRVEVIVIN